MTRDLTPEETAWLDRIKKHVDLEWKDLNSFQQKFIEDLLERYDRYGKKTFISPKQWEVITEISEKVI